MLPDQKSTKSLVDPVFHWAIRRNQHGNLEAFKSVAKPWGDRKFTIQFVHPSRSFMTQRRVSASAIVHTEKQAWERMKERCLSDLSVAEQEITLLRKDIPQIVAALSLCGDDR